MCAYLCARVHVRARVCARTCLRLCVLALSRVRVYVHVCGFGSGASVTPRVHQHVLPLPSPLGSVPNVSLEHATEPFDSTDAQLAPCTSFKTPGVPGQGRIMGHFVVTPPESIPAVPTGGKRRQMREAKKEQTGTTMACRLSLSALNPPSPSKVAAKPLHRRKRFQRFQS